MERFFIALYKFIKIGVLILLGLMGYYLINIGNNYVEEDKKLHIDKRLILKIILSVVTIIGVYNLFKEYSILSDTFYTILVSIVLAYLFNPIVKFFESKKIPRFIGVLLLYLIIVGIILIFAFAIFPKIAREIRGFIKYAPEYIDGVTEVINNIIDGYDSALGELPPMFNVLEEVMKENLDQLQHFAVNGLKSFVMSIIGLFSKVVSLVLTPILTFYFLVDKEYFTKKLLRLIPKDRMDENLKLFKEIDRTLSSVVRGRLIMAVYVGITITIVLLLLGVDFAIVIGFITGFADIIPYIGPFLGFLPAVFFAFVNRPIKALWVSIIFLVIQWTENNVLAPKVLGQSAGLHPMIILLSIILGGGMFGVMGMILAVPIVAVAIIIYKHIRFRIMEKTV